MTRRRGRVAFVAAALSVLAPLWLATTASAADPVTVSVSDVSVSGSEVRGVLNVVSRSAVQLDPASLTAVIDGTEHSVSIEPTSRVERRAMLVIDTSGSMGREGMATVRAATASYLAAVPSDVLVGVASFATTAGVDLAPTADRAAVQQVVDGLVARGDTSLYAGVQAAVKALGTRGDRSMVLLSDGADTMAPKPQGALAQATQALKTAGIRVDVVRFKSDDEGAAAALRGFAQPNGGTLVAAEDTAAVVAAFKASAKALESQVPFVVRVDGALSGSHTITFNGRAGGTSFTATRAFQAAAASTGAKAPAAPAALALPDVPRDVAASWYPGLAALLTAAGVFALAGATLTPSLRTRREERVSSIESYVVGPKLVSRSEGKSHGAPLSQQLTAFGERAMEGRKASSWVVAQIERADLPFRVGDWFVLSLAASLVGAALGFVVLAGMFPLNLLVGGIVGAAIPQMVLRFLARRRAKQFEAVLPDVLMLVATSLRSGFGLPQALDAVARDAAEPAAKEFSRALAETRIGLDIADALEHAAVRMDSKALRWTIMAIRIQREVGGNLAETLLTTASTLRERESLFRQVRALSAEGRISAYILVALPVFMFVWMLFTNYSYISLLWTRPMGLLMLVASVVMIGIGGVWMRRTVRIEV